MITINHILDRRDTMKKYFSAGICLLLLILISPQVFGETINFGDTNRYWPGWQSNLAGTYGASYQTFDNTLNSTDHYGTPDILGGTAIINNGSLTNLTFNVKNTNAGVLWGPSSPGVPYLMPADLFIDTNDDRIWDYVVNLIGSNNDVGDYGLYPISQPLNATSGYDKSTGFFWSDRRYGHPIGETVTGAQAHTYNVTFGGWVDPGVGNTATVTFDFTQGGIPLVGSEFAIGWTVNCANDVIYEELNHQVPEPANLLLLGLGLIGLAGIGRKSLFAKRSVENI
jgi:hypothetical protein